MARGGNPGAILGIGTGVFLIGLAYTGRISAVVDAALHGRKDTTPVSQIDPPDDIGLDEAQHYLIPDCQTDCYKGYSGWQLIDKESGKGAGAACIADGKTPEDMGLDFQGAYTSVKCGSPTGGQAGQAFLDLVPTPSGGWAYKNQGGTRWNPAHHGAMV